MGPDRDAVALMEAIRMRVNRKPAIFAMVFQRLDNGV